MSERKRWLKLFTRIQERVKAPLDDRLTLEQLEFIIQSINRNSYLEACPGSGKTEVVGIKAASVISQWAQPFSGIAVLSFTQNAAGEICQRISRYAGVSAAGNPHFAGTFDSWLHQYILQPFGAKEMKYDGKEGDKRIRIVESDSHAYFLRNYSTLVNSTGRSGRSEIRVNRYSITPEELIEESVAGSLAGISDGDRRICLRNKFAFFAAGFATYQDCAYIAYKVLTGNSSLAERVARRFPCIIVDECQDLCRNQLAVLYRLMNKGCRVHLVGDPNQSIYEFRNVDPVHLKGFIENVKPVCPKLTRNHRSNQAIVNVCNNLVGSTGSSQGNIIPDGVVPVLLWQYSQEQISALPGLFYRFLLTRNIDPDKSAIIARGKSLLAKLNNSGSIPDGHTATTANSIGFWYRQGRTVAQMTSALEQFGSVLCHVAYDGHGRKQSQHCPDAFDPVDWRHLIHRLLSEAKRVHDVMSATPRPNWKSFAVTLRE